METQMSDYGAEEFNRFGHTMNYFSITEKLINAFITSHFFSERTNEKDEFFSYVLMDKNCSLSLKRRIYKKIVDKHYSDLNSVISNRDMDEFIELRNFFAHSILRTDKNDSVSEHKYYLDNGAKIQSFESACHNAQRICLKITLALSNHDLLKKDLEVPQDVAEGLWESFQTKRV